MTDEQPDSPLGAPRDLRPAPSNGDVELGGETVAERSTESLDRSNHADEPPAVPEPTTALPAARAFASDGQFHELPARVQTLWFIDGLIRTFFLTGLALLADFLWLDSKRSWPLAPGLLSAFVFLPSITATIILPPLMHRRWRWAIRPHDVLLHFGVVIQVRRSIPRTRIQHVNITSGPISRAFGLVQVTLFTAGSDSADASLPGLALADAEALRELLLAEGSFRGF